MAGRWLGKQIPPLRYGMTTKMREGSWGVSTSVCLRMRTADSSATLRNDKQKEDAELGCFDFGLRAMRTADSSPFDFAQGRLLRCGMTNKLSESITGRELPICCEVLPGWIDGFDQSQLLFPIPVFEFLFAGYRVEDVGEVFVIDEAVYVVTGGECAGSFSLVLRHAYANVVCHPDVKIERAAGEDVDVKHVFTLRHGPKHTSRVNRQTADSSPFDFAQGRLLRCGMTNKRMKRNPGCCRLRSARCFDFSSGTDENCRFLPIRLRSGQAPALRNDKQKGS